MGLSRTFSEIDGDFSRKLQNFPHPCVFCASRWRPFPLELVSAQGQKKTEMMALPRGSKSFKIGLAV